MLGGCSVKEVLEADDVFMDDVSQQADLTKRSLCVNLVLQAREQPNTTTANATLT